MSYADRGVQSEKGGGIKKGFFNACGVTFKISSTSFRGIFSVWHRFNI